MWKVTVRGLLSHWLRFVMTAIAIVLGISFLVGSFVITDTIRAAFDDLFAQTTKGTDAIVRNPETVKTDFQQIRPPVAGALLDRLRRLPQVRVAEGFIQVDAVRMIDKHGDEIGGLGAPEFGYSWTSDRALSPWKLSEGRAPRNSSEVVIDRGTAKQAHFAIGDRIKILTRLPQQRYTVVGITRFGRVDRPLGSTAALFTPAQAQRIAGYQDAYDHIALGAAEGVSQSDLQAGVRAALPETRLQVLTGEEYKQEQQSNVRKQLKFFNLALGVFAAIGLLVGAFIIFNTFAIVIAQRTRELALLRAIGASPAQVFRTVLIESSLVGLIAAVFGVFGGVGLAAGLRAILGLIGIALPGGAVIVAARTVVLGVVVGLSMTVLSAMVPAWKAGRIPPIAALRSVALEQRVALTSRITTGVTVLVVGTVALLSGLFLIDGSLKVWCVGAGATFVFAGVVVAGPALVRPVARFVGWPLPRLRGMAGTLARENAIRSPRRTSRTAVALTLGVALVGFITIFGASVKASLIKVFGQQLHADYIVAAGGGFSGGMMSPDVTARVAKLPQVEAVTGLRFAPAATFDPKTGKKHEQFVTALDTRVLDRILDAGKMTGRLSDITDGAGISRKFADHEHLRRGDRFALQFGQEVKPVTLTVQAIYERAELAGPILVSISTFAAHVPSGQDFLAAVMTKPGVTVPQMKAAMKPIIKAYPIIKLQSRKQYIDAQAAQVDQIVGFIYGLLALAVIIALLGIANTLALSVHERTHEIGLLRAVGMSRRQVRTSIRWEAVIIAFFGTATGLVIGLFFGWAITASLRDQGFTEFDIAPTQLVVVVVVAAVAAILAALVPAWRAARLDVLDAIRTE